VAVTPTPTSMPQPTATATNTTTTTTIIVGQGGGTVPASTVMGKTQIQGQVQELPNTGLPLAGITLLALAPLGWKLRGYGFKNFNPSSIWQDRELKR
jgi:hypothetical protein